MVISKDRHLTFRIIDMRVDGLSNVELPSISSHKDNQYVF